jgi:hypothetical protein
MTRTGKRGDLMMAAEGHAEAINFMARMVAD